MLPAVGMLSWPPFALLALAALLLAMAATLKDWQNQTILALCALLRGRKSSSPSSKTSVDVTLATLLEDVWQHEERRPGDVAGRLFPDQPGVESRVRAYATWLREALEMIADTPSGKRLPFDVRLEHGTWQLEFKPRDFDLKRFWAPHVSDRPTVVVCTAPLFIRNLRLRVLVRQLDLNRDANWREHAQRWLHEQVRRFNPRGGTSLERGLSQLFTTDFEAKRPYSTVGELKCTLRLAACMNRIGVPFEHALAHEPYPHSHMVMLGNARTNYTLNRFQKKHHLKFQLREASVRVGSGAGAVDYRDDLRPDGHVYGTIARFVDDGRAVTTIASNPVSYTHLTLPTTERV